jgi:hypothetical protein
MGAVDWQYTQAKKGQGYTSLNWPWLGQADEWSKEVERSTSRIPSRSAATEKGVRRVSSVFCVAIRV